MLMVRSLVFIKLLTYEVKSKFSVPGYEVFSDLASLCLSISYFFNFYFKFQALKLPVDVPKYHLLCVIHLPYCYIYAVILEIETSSHLKEIETSSPLSINFLEELM